MTTLLIAQLAPMGWDLGGWYARISSPKSWTGVKLATRGVNQEGAGPSHLGRMRPPTAWQRLPWNAFFRFSSQLTPRITSSSRKTIISPLAADKPIFRAWHLPGVSVPSISREQSGPINGAARCIVANVWSVEAESTRTTWIGPEALACAARDESNPSTLDSALRVQIIMEIFSDIPVNDLHFLLRLCQGRLNTDILP